MQFSSFSRHTPTKGYGVQNNVTTKSILQIYFNSIFYIPLLPVFLIPQTEWPIVGKNNIQQFTRFVLRTPVVIAHSTIVNSQKEFLSDFEFAVYFFSVKNISSVIYNKKNMVICCKSLKKIIVLLALHHIVRPIVTT